MNIFRTVIWLDKHNNRNLSFFRKVFINSANWIKWFLLKNFDLIHLFKSANVEICNMFVWEFHNIFNAHEQCPHFLFILHIISVTTMTFLKNYDWIDYQNNLNRRKLNPHFIIRVLHKTNCSFSHSPFFNRPRYMNSYQFIFCKLFNNLSLFLLKVKLIRDIDNNVMIIFTV